MKIILSFIAITLYLTTYGQHDTTDTQIDWEKFSNGLGVNDNLSSVIGTGTEVYRTMEYLDYINKNTDWKEASNNMGMDSTSCKILMTTSIIAQKFGSVPGLNVAIVGTYWVSALSSSFKEAKNSSVKPGSTNYPHFINHAMASYGKDTIVGLDESILGTIIYKSSREIKYLDENGEVHNIASSMIKHLKLNKLPTDSDKVSFSSVCYYVNAPKQQLYASLNVFAKKYFDHPKFEYTNMIKGKDNFAIHYSDLKVDSAKGTIQFSVKDDILLKSPWPSAIQKGNRLVRHELKYDVNIICEKDKVSIKINNIRTYHPNFRVNQVKDGILTIEEVLSPSGRIMTAAYKGPLKEEHYNIINVEVYNDKQCICELNKAALSAKLKKMSTADKEWAQKQTRKCINKKNNANSQAVNNIKRNLNTVMAKVFLSIEN